AASRLSQPALERQIGGTARLLRLRRKLGVLGLFLLLLSRLGLGQALDRKADTLRLHIHVEHEDFNLIAFLDDVAGPPYPLVRKLRDMDQAFHARLEFHKRPKFHQARYFAADDGVVRILAGRGGPGIFDHLAVGKADSARLAVDLLDPDADRLAFLQDFAGMLDAAPRQLADVEQAIDPVA